MSGVGKRYAEALVLALGEERPDKVLEDLASFGGWLKAIPELRITIENPGIPFSRKAEIVREVAKQAGFAEISIRFVLLAVTNKRVRQWEEFVEAFRVLCDQRLGIQRAKVVSARPMGEARRAELQSRLAEILGKPVEVETAVSEALLGGLQLYLGSTVYDGSVVGALKSLHESLVKG